ncbi:YceI family protein [Pedobacter sp. ASV28]|uniref:YceI family protein n=1 Tax=Pedobacter sp. ASV28 TaxID=2795123 RepID=UPI0018EA404E|nr:YceI family protein [Pedobacter sp. ASV28]
MTKLKTIILLISLSLAFTACQQINKQEIATYQINSKTSAIEWKGSAPHHFHSGSFDAMGEIVMENDTIKGGDFSIPIASITNYELPAEPKEQLLTHLKSPDFFNAALHPYAKFLITHAKLLSVDTTAQANYLISGDFTLIGQTHPLSFPAKIIFSGDSLKATATFKFDRLKWGMTSYNDPAQEMYILPDIEVKLNIHAAKKQKQ